MNFLNVFEERVGNLFGATAQGVTAPFSFKKLAKKAAREMESETYVVNGVDTAPALYTILVSSDDDLVMRPLYGKLTTECAQFIEGQAQAKGYVFVGRPVVRFMADPSLRSGRFSVFAENVDAQTLNRLREEEARFLGADTSASLGLGGAAAVPNEAVAAAAPVEPASPLATPVAAQAAEPVAPLGAASPAMPAIATPLATPVVPPVATPAFNNLDAGLDVMPQDDVYPVSAQAAVPGIATPVAAQAAMPQQAAVPQQTAIPQVAPQVAVPGVAPVAAPQTVRVAQATAAPAAAPITALLIDRTSGRTYTVNAPRTVIGRERNAGGIVLHDPNVSRAHAEITFDGRGWNIRDLNSTNGTLVNDTDISTCALNDGDLITLGLTNLEFRGN